MLTERSVMNTNETIQVSIPLFSGLHADERIKSALNVVSTSQSLCFQGFMLT